MLVETGGRNLGEYGVKSLGKTTKDHAPRRTAGLS